VCGIITPFNFPLAIPTWKMFPALVCGNACVFKPAEDVPHTGHVLVEVMLEAGLPPEVIQLVHGEGEAGRGHRRAPRRGRRVVHGQHRDGLARRRGVRAHAQAPLAGDGRQERADRARRRDLDLAIEGVLWGAFGTTGQRCTATSRLVLQAGIHDRFVERLTERARGLKLGDGRQPGTDVGPLINDASRAKVERYVGFGREDGATLVTGGERARGRASTTASSSSPRSSRTCARAAGWSRRRSSAPVLSVVRVQNGRRGVPGEQRREVRAARRRSTRATCRSASGDAGPRQRDHLRQRADDRRRGAPAVRRRQADRQRATREGGWEVYEFYSETKVCYVDYSGTLQRAQIDNYLGTPTDAWAGIVPRALAGRRGVSAVASAGLVHP
jgi:aldehyde dehydrogenase (NAD+)